MAQLPPGFQLEKKSAALPPGFQLERPAAPAPVTGGTVGPDPSLDLPVPAGQFADGVWTPSGGIDPAFTPTNRGGGPPLRAPSSDPMRSLEVGFQGMRRGAAAVPGTFIDLTNALMNLGLMGADAGVDALGNPMGLDVPARMSPKPFGGTDFNTDVIEAVVPGEPYKPEEMTPGQRLGYKANEFGTAALIPGAALATQTARTAAQVAKSPMLEALTHPYTQGATPMSDAVAGGGAGVGSFAYDEYVPDPVKEALGPIGEVIAMLGGATGSNLLENLVKTSTRAVTGGAAKVATGGVDTNLPLNPDGSFVKSKDADTASLYVRGMAADPEKAAGRIREQADNLGQFGSPDAVPTTGLLSDDPGLVGFEQGFRLDPNKRKDFITRDQATERAALRSAEGIAPEDATGRQFTDTIGEQHNQRVDVAQRRVGWSEQHKAGIDQRRSAEMAEVAANRGGKTAASQRLDQTVAPKLTEAQARKNAAFDAIDPTGEVQRPVDPLMGAVGEIETRTGVLNDPAGQPGGVMERIRTLAENGGTISFQDLNAARPELAGQIAAARKAGNYTLADNLARIKGVIDEETTRLAAEGGEAGVRAQDALREYSQFAETWARGPGDEATKFRKDFNLDRQNRSTTPPSQTAERFLQPGQPEKVASLRRILGGDKKGASAVGDFLASDLAEAPGVISNGVINPTAVRKWMAKWGDEAMGMSPEFRQQVDDLLQRADVSANDASVLARQLRDAEKQLLETKQDSEAVRRVLGKDPVNAIRGIFTSGDPEATIKELMGSIRGNESARNGLKAAVREYIMERATNAGISRTGTGENPLSFAKLDEMFKQHENVLAEIFTPAEMNSLRASHQFLAPLKNLEMRTTVGSPTSANERLWNSVKGPLEVGFKLRYGVLKGGGLMRTLSLWKQMLPNGDKAAMELIERMWFDPDLAEHLLTRNVSQVGSSSYNKKLIRLLSYGAGARELVEE